MTIPGIGVLNATALIAAIGHGKSFARVSIGARCYRHGGGVQGTKVSATAPAA
jgi:hypothetical protein